jgi:hypothetical protein
MRTILVPLLLMFLAFPRVASADTITWFASGQVSNVSDPFDLWPGLVPGTPWALTFTLNTNAPASRPAINPPGCNFFAMGTASFTLGPHTYTHGGGAVRTNFAHPAGCTDTFAPEEPEGLITFHFQGPWTQEPGAWDLGLAPANTLFSYYDLLATDGGLPIVPVLNPNPGLYDGWEHEGFGDTGSFGGQFIPTAFAQPAPVPEPATMTLFGAGLAAILAARRKLRR